jgi:regulator of sigma E protease
MLDSSLVYYWALVIIGFGFLIFVHELGHFVAAKLVGIRVIRFALGFGPRLFGTNRTVDYKDPEKRRDATDYCVNLIPCGGYVRMAGGEGMEETTGAPDEFPSKTPGQRAFVVLAGPTMSVLTAIPLLFGLFLAGFERPSSRIDEVIPYTEETPETAAWRAGLMRGDRVTGIRHKGDVSWEEIRLWREVHANALLGEYKGEIEVRIEREGREKIIDLTTKTGKLGVSAKAVGGNAGFRTVTVGHVPKDGAAWKAGLRPGAVLQEIAGRTVHTWEDVELAIVRHPDETVPVTYILDDKRQTSEVRIGAKTWLGLGVTASRPAAVHLVRPGFPAAEAGLKEGDRIVSVDGEPVTNWPELAQKLVDAAPGTVKLEIRRPAPTADSSVPGDGGPAATLEIQTIELALRDGARAGDVSGIAPPPYPVVTGFREGSSAADAGIPIGAKLTRVGRPNDDEGKPFAPGSLDRVELLPFAEVSKPAAGAGEADESPEQRVLFYETNGAKHTARIDLTPFERGTLKLNPRIGKVRAVKPGRPIAALTQAVHETFDWARFAVRTLIGLFRLRIPADMVSGPVMLLTASRYEAEAGFGKFIEFMVIITVHLGIINLVPFPILDGGHVAFIAIEKLRGKPLPKKVMERLLIGGMVALITVMILVTAKDTLQIWRLFGGD